jgi:hypothetical protein
MQQQNSQTKQCQNKGKSKYCMGDFDITPDDFTFYEKMKVPPPTFCPMCRTQRRMVWRNEHNLYKKKDEATNELVFSGYPPNSPVKIYNNEYWWGDKWDAVEYGQDYDFSQSFFRQFKELLYSVPLPARVNSYAVNSDYSNNAGGLKDCYLCFNCNDGENCSYGIHFNRMKNSVNFSSCSTSDSCCNAFNITDCYKVFMSADLAECVEVMYSYDCRNCQNCIACVGLRNKNYCIENVQYTKEEYLNKINEINLGSYSTHKNLLQKLDFLVKSHPRKYMHTMKSTNVSGEYVFGSKNTLNSFLCYKAEDIKYCQDMRQMKDSYDVTVGLFGNRMYESVVCGLQSSGIKFSFECHPSCLNLEYSIFCPNSSNVFGCIGLKNKSYCVFNKQYTKEAYFELIEKIKKQMNDVPYIDDSGRIYTYGEFFPYNFSPFTYNETIAQEFFPLEKNEVSQHGFTWKDVDKRGYEITQLTESIPDHIDQIPDSYIDEIIECEDKELCNHNCTKAFKVIESELSFYKKNTIYFPRKCPNCRHYERIQYRNSLKVYKRNCMCSNMNHVMHTGKCQIQFETSYSPDRPEIVYCEKCYQQEVL